MSKISNYIDQFEIEMDRIDEKLSKKDIPIPYSPIHATPHFSSDIEIPLSIKPPPFPGMSDEEHKGWLIPELINDWYKSRYGDSLDMDWGPGRMGVLINNDVWPLRIPQVLGTCTIYFKREKTPDRGVIKDRCNGLDCIENLPMGVRRNLSDEALLELNNNFMLCYSVLTRLRERSKEVLVAQLLADLEASINHMMGTNPNYGLSKWSSLQASEKLLKAAIKFVGETFQRTHELGPLVAKAQGAGVNINPIVEISHIQCSAGIRYGDEACNKIDAIKAHQSFFQLAKATLDELDRMGK